MTATQSPPSPVLNAVRIGYARVSTRGQDHQMQLDALGAAHCREIVVETATTRAPRPKLRAVLASLRPGDTLVIYKPDRVARSMKELLVLLEDQLHARGINLEILTGICAGTHRPHGATIADKMLFMVAAMAAEMERELISERTLDGLAAAAAQGRRGGRPVVVDHDALAIALARQKRGEPVTAIAKHLGIGRSTLYRALQAAAEEKAALDDHDAREDQAVIDTLDATIAALPPDTRPEPTVEPYDQLLTHAPLRPTRARVLDQRTDPELRDRLQNQPAD